MAVGNTRTAKGFNVLIDLLPPDGRITLRVPEEKAE
jgi:hypothetical protein